MNKFKNSTNVNGHRDSREQVKIFSNAYFYLISHLIEFVDFQSETGFDVLYHIGESHCLSYAHSHISINENKYSICPKLTLGGKAFHFADPSNNGYKEITLNNLNSLRKQSIVFISFGEIDCRENEGLVTASNKLGIQLETLVQETVFRFVTWFIENNFANKHEFYFFNVPAPVYDANNTVELNSKRNSCINLFNTELKKVLERYQVNLIDVYKHTIASDGFSNNIYHCDKRHLDQRILVKIQKEIDMDN